MALGITCTYEGYNFSHGAATGVMAAGLGAGAEIYQFRWAPGAGTKKCRILCVQVSAAVDTVTFGAAAGAGNLDLCVARAWTAAGTGGGAVTPATNDNKLRTSQNRSLFLAGGEIRIATTQALGAGTKTLDAQPLDTVTGACGAAGTQIVFPIPLYVDWAAYGIPLVLDHQEGFVIRATIPGTGTWKGSVWVAWAEID